MIAHLRGRERALESFGLTGRRAEWIALASLHGGVFTRTQLSAWLGIDRFKALRFVWAMTERRLAAEETVGGLKVCRICARGIYRALGAEDIRHRRIASTEVLMRRLLSLDYVIEHSDLPWLPTEDEKVAAYEALGISRSLLPVRVYRGASCGTRRYFLLGLPVALDSSRAVFLYADPGYDTATALRSWRAAHRSWRAAHRRLWEALREQAGRSRPSVSRARRGNSTGRGRSSGTGPRRPLPPAPSFIQRPPPRPGARSRASSRPSGAWTTRRSRKWGASKAASTGSSR